MTNLRKWAVEETLKSNPEFARQAERLFPGKLLETDAQVTAVIEAVRRACVICHEQTGGSRGYFAGACMECAHEAVRRAAK